MGTKNANIKKIAFIITAAFVGVFTFTETAQANMFGDMFKSALNSARKKVGHMIAGDTNDDDDGDSSSSKHSSSKHHSKKSKHSSSKHHSKKSKHS